MLKTSKDHAYHVLAYSPAFGKNLVSMTSY
jgi:hypothetical protein